MSYIAISTSFQHEWCLAMPAGFGIDFANRTVTPFDEGTPKILKQSPAKRVTLAMLVVPSPLSSVCLSPEGSNKEACLENFKNKVIYVNSFTISQKDMLQSTLRVTGTNEGDWTITKEPAQEWFATSIKEMQEGKLISRVFYPDDCGDFEHNKGTLNSLLNLPNEDMDEASKAAIERSKANI